MILTLTTGIPHSAEQRDRGQQPGDGAGGGAQQPHEGGEAARGGVTGPQGGEQDHRGGARGAGTGQVIVFICMYMRELVQM